MATPWAKALNAAKKEAKTSLETATQAAEEAAVAFKAARQSLEAAQGTLQEASVARYDAQAAIDGLTALQKLLKAGDAEVIESVLTDAHLKTDGPTGWRQDICIREKYAQVGKVRFGLAIVWSEPARRCRNAWTALVKQGVLPPLDELLSQLKEP